MKLWVVIFNVWLLFIFLILALFFILFLLPIIFLPEVLRFRNRLFYAGTSRLAKFFLWAARIKLTIEGQEHVEYLVHNPAVVVLNHQSAFDIFIAEILLGGQPRLYFSNDYSKVFLLGTILRRMHVLVRRASPRSSKQSLDQAVKIARAHDLHVIIFPEGTRHHDGKIHKFYRGFTILSQQLVRPVVPIFLYGLHKIKPKGSFFINYPRNQVIVRVGAPLEFNTEKDSQEEFLEKVHNWFTLECNKVNS